jgi:hypothetical protein
MLDSVGVGFPVNEEFCFKLEGSSNETTKNEVHTRVKDVNRLSVIHLCAW